jgi:hypothetical protein
MDAIRQYAENIIREKVPPEVIVAAKIASTRRQLDKHLSTIHRHIDRIRVSQVRTERMLDRLFQRQQIKAKGERYQSTLPQDKEDDGGFTAADMKAMAAALAVGAGVALSKYLKQHVTEESETLQITADNITIDADMSFIAERSILVNASSSGVIVFKADRIEILRDS